MHRNDKQNFLKRAALAAAISSALIIAPAAAHAAGMGRITVLSALGQPLRAELEVTASREEMASLTARVAPVEAFRQANIEYAGVLSTVKFVLDKRADGKVYFKIQTDRPVNEPFIDFLVELNWSSGRLVREYAFLLDPPELKRDVPALATQAPVAESTSPAGEPKAESATASEPKRQARDTTGVRGESAPESEGDSNTRRVKRGDTLSKIALESAAEGVTLDQMLVALFNSNRGVFDGGNMNRLRAGKILAIPDIDAARAVNVAEARKIVVAQSADFNAYRNSLAASAARQAPLEQQAQQSSSGKITPRVEDKVPAVGAQDKLQVSRSEAQAKTGKGMPSEEDIVARDRALKEANSRIADLEKNLADLKKLAELKSQAAAEAQKAATVASTSEAPAAAPVVTKLAEASAPAETGVTVAAAPEAPAVSATAATPAAQQPQPKPKKKLIPPPPPPEPSFVEDNPLLVYGGSAAIAAVLGFLGFRTWKRKRDAASDQDATVSNLAGSSVFGLAANERVAATAVPQSDFGQSAFDSVDTGTDGVDPIQEAEVYMAYGRDGQAEEILVDAMQKDPGNLALYLKLLEIYAGRKNLPQFNQVASALHTRTGGSGPDWVKAATLGRSLDPANPMYGGTASPEPMQHDQAVAVESVPAGQSMAATMVMQAPPPQEAPVPAETAPAVAEEVSSALDFDFDLGLPASAASAESSSPSVETVTSEIDFDLDLGGDLKPVAEAAPTSSLGGIDVKSEASNTIDFDIVAPVPVATKTTAAPSAEASREPALDFDFDLGESASTPAVIEPAAPPLDLSSINLDLSEPAAPVVAGNVGDSSEVATKLELAHAYEEMGDREGARELLQEVLVEGSSAQQEAARSKLAQLG